MTDKHNEHLSALFDGEEVDSNVLERMLKSETDKATYQRYQLAGSILRDDIKPGMAIDISRSVAAHIASEPTDRVVSLDSARQRITKTEIADTTSSRWWRPAASFAVAASVALVTVIGVQTYQVGSDGQPMQRADNPVVSPSSPVLETQPFSGYGSPVSYNAIQEVPNSTPANVDQRRHIQSFFIDHQQQTQLSLQTEKLQTEYDTDENDSVNGN